MQGGEIPPCISSLMIVFNECRISPSGECVIIDASVKSSNYFDKVYIDSIIIDNQDSFTITGPSDNPVYSKKFEVEDRMSKIDVLNGCGQVRTEDDCDCLDEKGKCGNVFIVGDKYSKKHIRLALKKKDFKEGVDLNKDILFVWAVANGVPLQCTPCGWDNINTLAVATNLDPIYKKSMAYIKELSETCKEPKGFIDYILRLKAFDLAIKSGHYKEAIDFWNLLREDGITRLSTRRGGCGCGSY